MTYRIYNSDTGEVILESANALWFERVLNEVTFADHYQAQKKTHDNLWVRYDAVDDIHAMAVGNIYAVYNTVHNEIVATFQYLNDAEYFFQRCDTGIMRKMVLNVVRDVYQEVSTWLVNEETIQDRTTREIQEYFK